MTKDKFISLLTHPQDLTEALVPDLKDLLLQYPYLPHTHILLAKIKQDTKDIQSDTYINKAAIYAANKRNLYYFLHPEAVSLAEPVRIQRDSQLSGNYFDMIEKVESKGGDTKQSLKSLAERLKASREAIQGIHDKEKKGEDIQPKTSTDTTNAIRIPTPDYFIIDEKTSNPKAIVSEENAKKLIKEKKYTEAIVILNELNLIYPKKSIYFADQIRFLEKILVNTKK